jgi:sugar O-acyltransferase (sialic acid O-acetyltransferase NeuD family)
MAEPDGAPRPRGEICHVVILGAGGHGQVAAEALLAASAATALLLPVGFLDDDPALSGKARLGLPILGPLVALAAIPHGGVIVGIGDNGVRRRIYDALNAQGEQMIACCHPRAYVAVGATVGRGTLICAGAVVGTGAAVGANVILNTGCSVDHHNVIGDHAHVAPGARLGGDITVGAGSLVGIGAVVLPGRKIGAGCVVGAGALVTRDVPDGAVVVGNPARVVTHR